MVRPFNDEILTKSEFIREFSGSLNESELTWHRDERDRTVTVIEGRGWKFQFENSLPVELNPGDKLHIPKDSWHRLILGKGGLMLFISEGSGSENSDKIVGR